MIRGSVSHQDVSQAETAVLIPVKAFNQAKGRLSGALEPAERATLAQAMATHVVRAQGSLPVAVCCDDDGVAAWAESVGASVIWCPGTDLNGAVTQGFTELRGRGVRHVAIAHGDLPLATSLAGLLGWPGVTIVADRHRTGTNVMALPTDLDFSFAYGTGSFIAHVTEAVRHRRGIRIVHDPDLGWDVDWPEDFNLIDGSTVQQILENP